MLDGGHFTVPLGGTALRQFFNEGLQLFLIWPVRLLIPILGNCTKKPAGGPNPKKAADAQRRTWTVQRPFSGSGVGLIHHQSHGEIHWGHGVFGSGAIISMATGGRTDFSGSYKRISGRGKDIGQTGAVNNWQPIIGAGFKDDGSLFIVDPGPGLLGLALLPEKLGSGVGWPGGGVV